jgi:hypothetical protein
MAYMRKHAPYRGIRRSAMAIKNLRKRLKEIRLWHRKFKDIAKERAMKEIAPPKRATSSIKDS